MPNPENPGSYAARAAHARKIAGRARDPLIAEANRRTAESYEELARLDPRPNAGMPKA